MLPEIHLKLVRPVFGDVKPLWPESESFQKGIPQVIDLLLSHGLVVVDAVLLGVRLDRPDLLAPRIGRRPERVVVQDLGYRWGSCGKNGRINFHFKTIMLPPRIVDYVIVHELAHLFEAHHTPQFWRRVERAMPDFAVRKQWLLEKAAGVVEL